MSFSKIVAQFGKSWHDFESTTWRFVTAKIVAREDKIVAQFWIMFSIVLCTNMKSQHDWCNWSWHDLTWSKTLFKYSLIHLLSTLGESHGNQMRELLGYLDILGWGSKLHDVILENQKRRLLGKGLCLLGRDSWGWKTHEWRVLWKNLGEWNHLVSYSWEEIEKWVELGLFFVSLLKLIYCNPFVSICKELVDNEAERSLSRTIGHCWTEQG